MKLKKTTPASNLKNFFFPESRKTGGGILANLLSSPCGLKKHKSNCYGEPEERDFHVLPVRVKQLSPLHTSGAGGKKGFFLGSCFPACLSVSPSVTH